MNDTAAASPLLQREVLVARLKAMENQGGVVQAQSGQVDQETLGKYESETNRLKAAEAEVEEALGRVEGIVFQGPNTNRTSARAHVVLPSAAYVEREGTWTNVAGRVQRFWRAVLPRAEARADWEIVAALARALGQDWQPLRAANVFRDLAAASPAFAGLSYGALADHGAPLQEGAA
jgi:predicted molibdopterin-dependent oxidoreductase YjgC